VPGWSVRSTCPPLVYRPIADDQTLVLLELRQRRGQHIPQHVRALAAALVRRAGERAAIGGEAAVSS